MARTDDSSHYKDKWSAAKLILELRRTANMKDFGGHLPKDDKMDDGDKVREATRLYRDTWLDPIIDEIERRLVKTKKK